LPFAEKTSISSWEERLASLSASQGSAQDSKGQAVLPTTLSGFCERYSLECSSGKTSQAHFRASRTDSETSTFWFESMRNAGMMSHGEFLTLNLSEAEASPWLSRSDAVVCSLSDVLQPSESIPERYYLSQRACRGVLRRAESRGKLLPKILKDALLSQAEGSRSRNAPESQGGGREF